MSEKIKWKNRTECRKCYSLFADMSKKTIICADTETTGVTKSDMPVEISAIRYDRDATTGKFIKTGVFDEYIRSMKPMNPKAAAVNHITDEFLADKPSEEEICQKFHQFIGDPNSCIFVGYSFAFDIGMINGMYLRQLGIPFAPPTEQVVDVMAMAYEMLDRSELRDESYKQTNVAELYGISTEGAHNSLIDVEMCMNICLKLGSDYVANYRPKENTSAKPRMVINNVRWLKKSKTSNFVIFWVSANIHETQYYGKLWYDIYNKQYVTVVGINNFNMIDLCDMDTFVVDANAACGGSVQKPKHIEIEK